MKIERDGSEAFMRAHVAAHDRAVQRSVGHAKRGAPVNFGVLRGSIHNRPVQRNPGASADHIGSPLRYAAMREFGGVIMPVRARRLVWRDKMGAWHSATMVVQRPGGPGQGYQPFFRPAINAYTGYVQAEVRSII